MDDDEDNYCVCEWLEIINLIEGICWGNPLVRYPLKI